MKKTLPKTAHTVMSRIVGEHNLSFLSQCLWFDIRKQMDIAIVSMLWKKFIGGGLSTPFRSMAQVMDIDVLKEGQAKENVKL